jgi:hypothetical protein
VARRLDLQLIFQECRLFGHAWERHNPGVGTQKAKWGRRFHLLCTRCGTTREDVFNYYGALEDRDYKWPEGYKLAADERPNADELRVSVGLAYEEERPPARRKPAERAKPRRQHMGAARKRHARA